MLSLSMCALCVCVSALLVHVVANKTIDVYLISVNYWQNCIGLVSVDLMCVDLLVMGRCV